MNEDGYHVSYDQARRVLGENFHRAPAPSKLPISSDNKRKRVE